jgi:hypothetical protein
MTSNFLIREDCLKRLRELCNNDTWTTAFALGSACQLLELGALNEVVEMVEEWSGQTRESRVFPDAFPVQ